MNLFISYSSKSREAVQQLASDLSDLGYTVWFDRELTGGHQWWAAILGQIRDCDVFIFALTPESLESFPCELEWKYARDCHKRILPVQLAEVRLASIPAGLQELQLVDYREQGKSQQAALNRALVKLPPAKPLPDPLPAEPPTPLSPLVRFGEQIDAPTLSGDEQILLVAKLRPFLDDADTKADALALLKRLRRRDDLLARTADEIGRLLDGGGSHQPEPTLETRQATHILPHEEGVYCAIVIGSDEFLTGSVNGVLSQWRIQPKYAQTFVIGPDEPTAQTYQLGQGVLRSIVFSPNASQIAVVGDESKIYTVKYPIRQEPFIDFAAHNRTVNSVAFTSDGKRLLSASDDGQVIIWSLKDGHLVSNKATLTHGDKARSVATSPVEDYAVSAGTDAIIRLWSISRRFELRRFEGHTSSVNSVAFSSDGRYVVSGSSDWTVRLWDATNGKEIHQFLGHSGRVSSVAFAPDGKHIVSAAADKRAIIWDIDRGAEMCHFVGHTDRINSVAFSPDGKYIVTASHDKTARVWETGL